MPFSLHFELAANHVFTQSIRLGKDGKPIVYCDDRGMTSNVYNCQVADRRYTSTMIAHFNTDTGTFDLAISLKQKWRLRDIFNGMNKEQLFPAGKGVSQEKALADLAAYESTCAETSLPVKEGRASIANHYANLKEVRDDTVPPLVPFKDVNEAVNALKPR